MHEMSIVSSLLEAAIPVAKENGAVKILSLSLKIGDMTEVVEDALAFAFEALSEGTVCEGATLTVNKVSPKSICLDCGNEFTHDRFHLRCDTCGSIETVLIAGRELEIMSIEVELSG